MVHQVKDLALSLQRLGSLLWSRFNSWPRNFHMLRAHQKNFFELIWGEVVYHIPTLIFSLLIMKSEFNFQELCSSLKLTLHGFIDSCHKVLSTFSLIFFLLPIFLKSNTYLSLALMNCEANEGLFPGLSISSLVFK